MLFVACLFVVADLSYAHADIACFPWVNGLSAFYKADDALDLASYKEVKAWLDRCMERPASKVCVMYCTHVAAPAAWITQWQIALNKFNTTLTCLALDVRVGAWLQAGIKVAPFPQA